MSPADGSLASATYEFGEFRFEASNSRLTRAGKALHAEPKVLRMLSALLDHAGTLVGREALRAAIWDGVAVTPGSLTRLVAALRRVLGDDAARPRFIETVHTRGYRWVAPLVRRSAQGSNLPERTVRLIGRTRELDELAAVRRGARLITVAGPAGCGKTTFACELGRRVSEAGTPVQWVDLSAAKGSDCARTIAASFGLARQPGLSTELALARAIGEQDLALFLDNCERVAARVSAIARTLLGRCPHLSILCTSQSLLDTPEELVFWLAPLSLPADGWQRAEDPAAELLGSSSVQLFAERARAVSPTFSVSAANAATIAAICGRLDGLPLALELGAARLSSMSPAQLLAALDDRFAVLARRHGSAGRHRSLSAAIGWSYGLLDASERALLDGLGVFTTSFPADSAHAVAGTGSRAELENGIQSLVQKSLLTVERGSVSVRYRLLDSVASFARARLGASGGLEATSARHAEHFAELVRRVDAELLRTDQMKWHRHLVGEWSNVAAAFEWARRRPARRRLACAVVAGLRFFWGEAVQWLRSPGDLVPEGTPAERARFFNGLAWIEFFSSRLPESREASRRAEREATTAGDRWAETYALAMHAWAAALEDDAEDARALSPRAIRLAEDAREPWLLALAHLAPLFVSMLEGDRAAACEGAAQVETHAAQSGDIFLIRFARTYLGFTHYLAGDPSAARRIFHPLAASMRSISSLRAKAPFVEIAALLAADESRPELATQLLGAADRLRQITGAPQLQPWHAPHARALAGARKALGDVGFERAWEAGCRAGADSALDLAIGVLAIL